MTSILKTLAVAVTLLGGIATVAGSASADTYGWAYPDKVPLHSLGVESGIPSQYR